MIPLNLYLEFINEQQDYEISGALLDKLSELLRLAGKLESVESGEVALSFVDEDTIHQLNKEYRGIDRPTDVLSFAMTEAGEDELPVFYEDMEEVEIELAGLEEEDLDEDEVNLLAEPLGDIVISVPRALAQAEEYGHSPERELCFLFVHGFLHLIGYDHETEEEEAVMFARQEEILAKAGITR